MTALRFAYRRLDGGISIVMAAPLEVLAPVIGAPVVEDGNVTGYVLSEADYRAHVVGSSIPVDATDVIELPSDWVAPDRASRAEWVIQDGTVKLPAEP